MARDAGLKPVVSVRLNQGDLSLILVARSMRGYALISSHITKVHLEDEYKLRDALISEKPNDYFIITKDELLLESGKENVYAEINVLNPNYGNIYHSVIRKGVKPVLIHPVYFLDETGFEIHQTLRAIFHRKNYWSLTESDTQSPNAYFRPQEEILKKYSVLRDAALNTRHLVESAYFEFQIGKLYFPDLGNDTADRLRTKCLENVPKRFPNAGKEVFSRLAKELEIINKKGFSDYFLVVEDIVKNGGMFTCGRGSGAASIVSYLLFITHVDPIRHNLYFERFLNQYREDPPDIDIDFCWDLRDRVTQYVFDTYGDRTAMVSNHNSFSSKSSVHEVAKLHGIPEKEILEVTKHVSHYYDKVKDDFIAVSEKKFQQDQKDEWGNVLRKSVKIDGIPRHLGLHCGGIVITPKAIRYYAPVQKSKKGFNAVQWEKDQTEEFGLVKIDLLGNRSLAVVRDTIKAVRENYQIEIKYEYLDPLEDEKTKEAIRKGNTMGVFYVESPAMRILSKKAGVGDYEHLVVHSSIIRPAANDFINEYLKRLHGAPWEPLIPEMRNILAETFGIMVYQEDISRVAVQIGGFHEGEGEELRKVISNPRKEKRKFELKQKLEQNLLRRGEKKETIEKLWQMIESFKGYSFCKPHSASYAQLSFKACYLKVYYRAEFMSAVLSNQGGFYCALGYVSEARRMGVTVKLPSINESRREWYGNRMLIYTGFMAIKYLSLETVGKIIHERETNGLFLSLKDFIQRTGTSPSELEILIKSGAFDAIENYNRPQLLYLANQLSRTVKGSGMFDIQETISVPRLREHSEAQLMRTEIFIFGYILSKHPMQYYRKFISIKGIVLGKDIARYIGKTIKIAGVLITTKTVITSKDELMKFVSFEDESAIIEGVMFPKTYAKFERQLNHSHPYIVTGKVDSEFGVPILNISVIDSTLFD